MMNMKNPIRIGLSIGLGVIGLSTGLILKYVVFKKDEDNNQYKDFDLTTIKGTNIKSESKTLSSKALSLTSSLGSITSIDKVSQNENKIKIQGTVTENSDIKTFVCFIEILDDLAQSNILSFTLGQTELSLSSKKIDATNIDKIIKEYYQE